MLEKWKQRIIQMNFKKGGSCFCSGRRYTGFGIFHRAVWKFQRQNGAMGICCKSKPDISGRKRR